MRRKLLVVDTETGGLDPIVNSILSFSAVIYQGGSIVGTFSTRVQEPTINVTDEATAVNGLTAEDAPTPWIAVQRFKQWLARNELYGKQTLAAHNTAFDSAFLRRLWALAGEDFEKQFDYRMLCTQTAALLLEQAGRIQLPGGSASLDNVAALFGLARSTEKHDSLEDAILCAKVLAKMVERIR